MADIIGSLWLPTIEAVRDFVIQKKDQIKSA